MRHILLILVALFFSQGYAQNYTTQDMTLQLDENGEATLIPEDVLVNTTGTVWVIVDDLSEPLRKYHYDQQSQTFELISAGFEGCIGEPIYYGYDRNPINKKEYASSAIIDLGSFFWGCEGDASNGDIYGDNECNFGFRSPLIFSFDKDGVLYENGYTHDLSKFDIYSNIRTTFLDIGFPPDTTGFTYDFDNHRLIASFEGGDISIYEIDIETAQWQLLFEIDLSGCNYTKAIEYIGNDTLLVGGGGCGDIFAIDLATQEMTLLASGVYATYNFLFIEDEIPDATLSQSQFTCSDVGAQTVDITVLENGIPVNYQATVNVVPDFSVRDCLVYRRLTFTDPNGSDDARVGDYTDSIEIVSSCSSSFTVTQDPPPGTLIPHEETVDIILTVTDEFGNTTLCKTVGCSDSPLAITDNLLKNSFVVYPNPTTDQITIENRNNILLSYIEILDINGRLLGIKEINSEVETISMSLASYNSGVYFVKISAEKGFLVKQIIKQ